MEIELKFKLKDKEVIKNKLKKFKARFLSKDRESDIYFDCSNISGKREFSVFRLRNYGKDGLLTLKYKGRDTKFFKERNEVESKVSDAKNTLEILKRLGFKEGMRKEKIRETYSLGGCLLLIDTLPFLGYFLEVESDNQEKIKKVVTRLGLNLKNSSPLNYGTIFHYFYLKNVEKFKHCKHKLELTFESEKLFNPKNAYDVSRV